MARFHSLDVVDVRRETRDAVVVTLKPQRRGRRPLRLHPRPVPDLPPQVRRRRAPPQLLDLRRPRRGPPPGRHQARRRRRLLDLGQRGAEARRRPRGHAADGPLLHPDRARRGRRTTSASPAAPASRRCSRSSRPCSPPSRSSTFTLVYANRQISSIMFREELEDLKNRYLGRLSIVHVLESEAQDIDLFTGRVDAAKCAALFRTWIDLPSVTTAFICGPEPMMLAIAGALQRARPRRRADQVRALRLRPARPREEARGQRSRLHLELHRGDGHPRRRHPQLPHAEGGHQPARRRARRRTSTPPTPARPASARPAAPRCWRARPRWPSTTRSRTTRSARATCSPASASR